MKNTFKLIVTFIFLLTACAAPGPPTVEEIESSDPRGYVTPKGNSTNLLCNAISIGDTMPSVELVDCGTMKSFNSSAKPPALPGRMAKAML